MNSRINVLCATDDNYVPYTGIMLTSLFENNNDVNFVIYVITEGLSEKNIQNLIKLETLYKQDIRIVTVNHDALSKCPIRKGDHVSIATYYRLLAAEILPKDVEKIIYLDVDIIVNGSLLPLWNYDLSNKTLGAVLDENYQAKEVYQRVKYPPKNKYFNAGVLLIDLNKWRKENLTKECFECIENRSEDLIFHDQDTINIVQYGKIECLPPVFNLQKGFLFTIYHYPNELTEEIKKACINPTIIHYTGKSKPWQKGDRYPFTPYFLYYKSISLWKDTPLKKRKVSLKNRFLQIRNEIIWKLGIMKRPISYIIPTQYHPNDKRNRK